MMEPVVSPGAGTAQREKRWLTHLERIQAGNSDALAQLYDETAGLLYSLALRVVNDPADAEEVILDVYQHVWKSTHTYDPRRGTILGWLTILTRSRAIDRLRSTGLRRSRELPIEDGFETRSKAPAPEAESMFAEERRRVRAALATLAPEQREAIELAFFRGLTHNEVAEAVGAPLGTIKTRIRIGMRKMRDALAAAEGES